jgi:site-specific recombinase XerD
MEVKNENLSGNRIVQRLSQHQLKKNTVKNYDFVFNQFKDEFGDRLVDAITPDEILSFLTKLIDGTKQSTKRNRYSSLKAFFNYIKNSIDPNFQNP